MNIKTLISKNKGHITNSAFYMGASLASALIQLVLFPLQSKYLSHWDYAIVGYFGSFHQLVMPIMSFSLINYYLRKYYMMEEGKREKALNTILFTLSIYGIVSMFIVLGVLWMYMKYNGIDYTFWPYAFLSFLPIYFTNFYTLYQVRCRMTRNAKGYFKITMVQTLLMPVFLVLLVVVFKFGAIGKLLSILLPAIIVGCFAFKKLATPSLLRFDYAIIKDAVSFAWPLSVSTMLWYFCGGVDRALLAPLGDDYNLGLYNIGVMIAGHMSIFFTVLMQTFEPDIYQAIAEDNKRRLLKFILLVVSVNAVINFLFIAVCPFVMDLLTAHQYGEAASYTRIVTLKNITLSLYNITNLIIIGYGFTKGSLGIRAVSALLSYAVYAVFISRWAFVGAAWGQVVSYVVMTIVALAYIYYLKMRGKLVIKERVSNNHDNNNQQG